MSEYVYVADMNYVTATIHSTAGYMFFFPFEKEALCV